MDRITHNQACMEEDLVSSRQKKKSEELTGSKHHSQPSLDTARTVVNIPTQTISEAATSVLSKGLNFAVRPTKIPTEEIIQSVEASLHQVPRVEAEKIRQETVTILQIAKPPSANIIREERQAIKELRNNKDIVDLHATKETLRF
ncbi:uncharacterized protein LOC126456611 [Schistocerca serialis cubense]|uniref:uncharacterized protein LOC126456611 n=1 Tax=Schistocerca serialis cubense TaxID=2023355 RepID=UPI00214E7559|nr:uncharacterized protein LOC126456611 [Schistocerca serialis cubense]